LYFILYSSRGRHKEIITYYLHSSLSLTQKMMTTTTIYSKTK
jgi:hypothetical protein